MKRPTVSLKESLVAGLVLLGIVVGLQRAVADDAIQCPSGGQEFDQLATVDGVTFEVSAGSLTMTNTTTSDLATVSWCAEGEQELTAGSTISGVMTTTIPGGESRSSSFDHDIVRFIVYSVVHQDSGGPGPPPRPGNGGGGRDHDTTDGGGDRNRVSGNSATPSNGPGSGGTGALAPPPPVIAKQPSVTG
jgi:hypothetical protein